MLSKNEKIKNIRYFLIVAAATLLLLHVVSAILALNYSGSYLSIFDLDQERNAPTIYTSLLLVGSSIITLSLVGRGKTVWQKITWMALSITFFYLSVDELFILHERVAEPLRNILVINNESLFFHAWITAVFPLAILIAGLGMLVRNKNIIALEQRQTLLQLALLALSIIVIEALGTRFYSTPFIYSLGPILIEEMLEISLISYILYDLVKIYYGATSLKQPT